MEYGFIAGITIGALIGGLIGTLIMVSLGPKVSEGFKLREIYLAPFREWCGYTWGELWEFYDRYSEDPPEHEGERKWKEQCPQDSLLLIIDFRELHEVLKDAPKWFVKIKEEEKEVFENFSKLMNAVDRIWHSLQDENPELAYEGKKFVEHIFDKTASQAERRNIANKIWDKFRDSRNNMVSCKNFKHITDYLKKKIPKK